MNSYAIKGYVSGKSAPASGFRLAVCTFKTDKLTKVKRDSVCAELPVISVDHIRSNISVIAEAVKIWCYDAQDAITRNRVVSGATEIAEEEISLEAIAAFMRESLASGRLTAEAVQNWYEEQMESTLMLVLSEKLGIDENSSVAQQQQLEKTADVYRSRIVSLSSGRTKYSKDEALKLLAAFERCSLVDREEDEIGSKLVTKLRVMTQADEAIELLAL